MKVFQKGKPFGKCYLEVIEFSDQDLITTSGPVDGFIVEDGGYFDEFGEPIID